MMRGAQSGGVVTYAAGNAGGGGGGGLGPKALPQLRGVRSRVVNGKRTDLSKLVRAKVGRRDEVQVRRHNQLDPVLKARGFNWLKVR